MSDKKYKGKGIIFNIIMLYVINIAKVVFPLITLPYLTRVLTIDCYGVVAYVKATMVYLQLVVNFGFMYSGVKDIAENQQSLETVGKITGNIIMAKCMLSAVSLCALLGISCLIDILRENLLYVFLSFVPIFLSTFLMEFLFRGLEQMQIITSRYLIMKSISVGLTLVVVKDNSDILWIPVLEIFSSLVAIVLTYIEIRKLNIKISFRGAVKGGYAALKTSGVYFASDIASTAFGAFNTLVIGIALNNMEVAVFSVCMQLVSAVQALYSPIYNGIYPDMVRKKDIRIIKKVLAIFIPIVIGGCIFTLMFSEEIMMIVAGRQYVQGANVLRCLVPVLLFSFIVMLFGWPALGAIGKVKETTITTVTASIIQIAGVMVMAGLHSLTLVSVSILRCFTEVLMLIMRSWYLKKYRNLFSH